MNMEEELRSAQMRVGSRQDDGVLSRLSNTDQISSSLCQELEDCLKRLTRRYSFWSWSNCRALQAC